jgi:hypothetical protein
MSCEDRLEGSNRNPTVPNLILRLLNVVDFEVFGMLLSPAKGQIQQVWVQGSEILR